MPNLTDSDLRDPSPPVPGDAQRAAVAVRAHQLGRKRRIMQGVGALGMVAAVAVGVAALTAGGTSGSGTSRIEAAGSAAPTTFSVSGTVSNIPAGATLTLSLSGNEGTFSAVADDAGNYSIDGVPAGEYQAMYEWEWADATGLAGQAGITGGVVISRDSNFSFSL